MLKKIINFYIYSSLHIALCAVLLAISTFKFYDINIDYNYLLFLGTGTITIYSLHRLIGIGRATSFQDKGRFAIVQDYKTHILFYTVICFAICLLLFLNFEFNRQLRLISLSLISLLYVLPVFGKGRRLRDLNYIKILLIGFVWSGITVTTILLESEVSNSQITIHSIVIFLFIVGITIPFDARDLSFDKENGVKTIATILSMESLKKLTTSLLTLSMLITLFLLDLPTLSILALMFTMLSSYLVIHLSWGKNNDYWHSGLLDGTMMLPFSIEFALDYFT